MSIYSKKLGVRGQVGAMDWSHKWETAVRSPLLVRVAVLTDFAIGELQQKGSFKTKPSSFPQPNLLCVLKPN